MGRVKWNGRGVRLSPNTLGPEERALVEPGPHPGLVVACAPNGSAPENFILSPPPAPGRAGPAEPARPGAGRVV